MELDKGNNELDSYKLETSFHANDKGTIHIERRRDRRGGKYEVKHKWFYSDTIGTGAFGRVWLQKKPSPDSAAFKIPKLRAVKELDKSLLIYNGVDFKKELEVLIRFSQVKYRHRDYFVEFRGWFEQAEKIYIAMEYVPLGALRQYIKDEIDENGAKQISTQILKGLQYMHKEGYTHRDIKPENTLVVHKQPESSEWWVKLADFGTTKRAVNNTVLRTETAGTVGYQAPELHPDSLEHLGYNAELGFYDNSADIWSFACTIFEIMATTLPFPAPNFSSWTFCKNRQPFPDGPLEPGVRTSFECVDFIKSVLKPLPRDRLTATKALQHAWLEGTNRCTEPQSLQGSYAESIVPLIQSPQVSEAPSPLGRSSLDEQALIHARQTSAWNIQSKRPPRNYFPHKKLLSKYGNS